MREYTLAVPAANGQGAAQVYYGGWSRIWCWGSFDSGTVTIQVSPDGGTTWMTATDADGLNIAFAAANGSATFHGALPAGATIRASLTGSSGGTAVTCKLVYGWAETRDREMAH